MGYIADDECFPNFHIFPTCELILLIILKQLFYVIANLEA